MPELGDLRLDKSADVEPSLGTSDRRGLRIMLFGVVAVVLAVAGYLVLRRAPPAQPSGNAAHPARVTSDVVLAPERGEDIPLPPLDETDALVRDLVGRLSSHPKVAAWLATDRLIRNFAVVTVNIADGQTPVKHLRPLAPASPFQASTDAANAVILPASYIRYDAYADAVASLDAKGTARLYATLKPRIQEAYQELGYPTGTVDEALKRAIVELLKTPVVEGRVPLKRSSVSYTFADQRLESLSAAQKQLLRMGPRNVRIVQDKLREIAPFLGVDPATLPAATVIQSGASR